MWSNTSHFCQVLFCSRKWHAVRNKLLQDMTFESKDTLNSAVCFALSRVSHLISSVSAQEISGTICFASKFDRSLSHSQDLRVPQSRLHVTPTQFPGLLVLNDCWLYIIILCHPARLQWISWPTPPFYFRGATRPGWRSSISSCCPSIYIFVHLLSVKTLSD